MGLFATDGRFLGALRITQHKHISVAKAVFRTLLFGAAGCFKCGGSGSLANIVQQTAASQCRCTGLSPFMSCVS